MIFEHLSAMIKKIPIYVYLLSVVTIFFEVHLKKKMCYSYSWLLAINTINGSPVRQVE